MWKMMNKCTCMFCPHSNIILQCSKQFEQQSNIHCTQLARYYTQARGDSRNEERGVQAREQNLINILLFIKLRHYRHYYHGALDLFFAETNGKTA